MSLNLVALADCAPQPWRNGGGLTRELLRWPTAPPADEQHAPASTDEAAWLVRVSVAEIIRDGPFSAYPGIERWFAVLRGAGVRLGLPAGERLLRAGDPPLGFAGEDAPPCALLDGPTQDLNLMCRRGPLGVLGPSPVAQASMRLAPAGSVQRGRLAWRALFAAGATRLAAGDETHELPAGTLAWSDMLELETWEVADTDGAFWMELRP
jgi:environmental stress-induced protein Ves